MKCPISIPQKPSGNKKGLGKLLKPFGVPALFPAKFFEHLLTLRGDRGAKPVLMQFENSLLKIPLPEAELDIDSKGDFDHLTVRYSADE